MAKLKQPTASRKTVLEVPPKASDSALSGDTQPAYFCPNCRASLLRMDVECISRFIAAMTCPACGVLSSIGSVIGTAKLHTPSSAKILSAPFGT